MFTPTSPVVGQTGVTGLTNPTFTLTADQASVPNAKQYVVSALGGTQTGVETHTASNPFTLTGFKPVSYLPLGDINLNSGLPNSFPKNTYSFVTRKGVEVYSGIRRIMTIKTVIDIPAGSEIQDPESISAAFVAHAAALHVNAAELRNTLVAGNL